MRFVFGLALAVAFGCSVALQAAPPVTHERPHRPHAPAPVGTAVNKHRPHGVRPLIPHGNRIHNHKYHHNHGLRFKHGFYYHGWQHRHWSYHFWDRRYGTYLYLDPNLNTYFYWCAPHFRFYPVTYVPLGTYSFPYVANPQPPAVAPPLPPPDPAVPNMPPAGP